MVAKKSSALIWRCLTCSVNEPPTGKGFSNLLLHPCTGKRVLRLIDKETGEELAKNMKQAYARGLIPKKPPEAEVPEKKPSIGISGDEHIKEHYQGYSKDGESFLFVMHPDGRVRDLRLEHPLLYPIFQLIQKEQGYGGDFPQFISDAIETLFANLGYELALVPKSQGIIYQEVVKLLEQGKLELVTNEDKVTLEVKNGNQGELARGQNFSEAEQPAGDESAKPGQGGEEEKPGESQ